MKVNLDKEKKNYENIFVITALLLFAAGLLCLMGVARGSDEEQLVREVVKAFVTDYNNGDFKNAPSYTADNWVHINPGGGITRGREEVLKKVIKAKISKIC